MDIRYSSKKRHDAKFVANVFSGIIAVLQGGEDVNNNTIIGTHREMILTRTGAHKKQEITAVVKNVTYKNTDSGYMVLKTKTGITLCGACFDADLQGVQIKAIGEWQKHKAYGMQFIFDELIYVGFLW